MILGAARHAGDLEALDALEAALVQARRAAIDMRTVLDAGSIAEAALALSDAWRRAQD